MYTKIQEMNLFIEDHFIYLKVENGNREMFVECYVAGTKCKTADEFNNLFVKYIDQ